MLGERRPLIDPADERAMSPPCSENKRMRCLIAGEPSKKSKKSDDPVTAVVTGVPV